MEGMLTMVEVGVMVLVVEEVVVLVANDFIRELVLLLDMDMDGSKGYDNDNGGSGGGRHHPYRK
ncbi:hypothetical protein HanHA300_Chr13g0490131 [Helianthus annuus]|nr:hypothetical protein HanHA300_Chr13g0490131 [Helianthus annuus]KAJ0482081.1 hypothetical protein HanIR_Chr13g0649911 [Helianthus annuus]KAJ0498405.1 hypothetical protein HanHA89_Chr13g0522241 [Helianthus annuus]KAJ0664416.1 hypothetical protein HanLR1_Chr13g0492181 [Helianthus annuus]KAJ0671876.1 hypothetical protein HanOQP8_Chr13g0490641 [Helianthus annuus]